MKTNTRVGIIALGLAVVVIVFLVVRTQIVKISVPDNSASLSEAYKNVSMGFALRYPQGFTIDETYKYQELGPGKDIGGVKFTIPISLSAGTNLAPDSYMSVEEIPQVQTCGANLFLEQGVNARMIDESGTTYSVASSTGAGAGNRYEETVYAIPGTEPCVAIRYFIHYGVIENYPAGMVQQFDKQALLNQFDAIRRTLVLGRHS